MNKIKRLYGKIFEIDAWDECFSLNVTKKIITDEYYMHTAITKKGDLLFKYVNKNNKKEPVDITKFYPKNVKIMILNQYYKGTLPFIPDTVEILILERCNITKFPFKLPVGLKQLTINFCENMTSLPDLSYLKKLWLLYIRATPIENLPENLPDSIKLLFIKSKKSLKKIPKKLPKNIVSLSAEFNEITKIPDLSYLKNLIHITLKHNKITEIPDNLPLNLETMRFDDNKITEIPDLTYLKNLESMSVRNNPIVKAHSLTSRKFKLFV